MKYTVYKITNTINGKYYIGKHQTTNLDDGYMGSGKLLKRAINKYGVENFTKEILYVFDTEQEMNDKEKELVVVSEEAYNLCAGGQGGFGYINGNGMNNKEKTGVTYKKAKETWKYNYTSNSVFKDNHLKHASYALSVAKIALLEKYPDGVWMGKKHSEKSKIKISEAAKGRVPWNKGKPRTDAEKQNIRLGMIKKPL